jgi:hypothetical protein
MLVKKTPSGKFSFVLDYLDRDEVASWLINYLEDESVKIRTVRITNHPDRHLFYYTLLQFYKRFASKLNSPVENERFRITPAEATALLVLLEEVVSIQLKEIRATLHKLLS